MNKIIEFPFAKLEIYDQLSIGTFNDGVLVNQVLSDIITETVLHEFESNPFVYVSNRVNSYAVDPSIYPSMSNIDNMVGFAVISENENSIRNAEFEKFFFKKPFEIFNSIERAKDWAKIIIKDFKKNVNCSNSD